MHKKYNIPMSLATTGQKNENRRQAGKEEEDD